MAGRGRIRARAVRRCIAGLGLLLGAAADGVQGEVVVFNDDGGWNWLQDERVIVAQDRLIIGSVAAGIRDPARRGNVEAVTYDLRTGAKERFTLHRPADAAAQKLWLSDHNSPAFAVRPDGRVLAVYAQHGKEAKFHLRLSSSDGGFAAGEARTFDLPSASRVTFANPHFLAEENSGRGRMINFFRGLENTSMPSWAYSDDAGTIWSAGNVFITIPRQTVPYVKYAGDGRDTVHMAFTDGHRVNFSNGVHHVFYRGGALHRSDGRRIRDLREGGLKSLGEATRIYQANAESVAMISDLALDARGHPHVVYSVQMNTASQRPRPVGADHRYRWARWTGTEWRDREIAHAGREVHDAPDDDCTGLIALDPQNPDIVYISTDVDPVRGTPLISQADGKRHWEIFRGETKDGGETWGWAAVTRDSPWDNIRPVVPAGLVGRTAVIWLRGVMRMPNDYELEVVGLLSNGG